MKLDLAEIQGLIASDYGDRPTAAYALFAITDVGKAQKWLGRVIDKIQFAGFLSTPRDEEPLLKPMPMNLALSHAGLAALGLMEATLSGFSVSFREGMATAHRARQLGDDHDSAPERWRWGGPSQPAVHGLLCVFAGDRRGEGDRDRDQEAEGALREELCDENGLSLLHLLPAHHAQKSELRKEHFGFRDGIGNPTIEGLSRRPGRDALKAGEVLLGYRNVYGKLPQTPRVQRGCDHAGRLPPSAEDPRLRDFGKNGSYLVFRQLEQDVAAFWTFAEQAAARLGAGKDATWLASRFVGRWPNGSPLTLFPDRASPAEATDMNDFLFSDHGDAFGEKCPLGSHIRRTNPRDTMLPVPHDEALSGSSRDPRAVRSKVALSDVHRLLRRGRLYGPPLHPTLDPNHMRVGDGRERGLYFLCVNANLQRQFEFVQSSWVVGPGFGGLTSDPDPLLAAQRDLPFPASDFTLQGCPAARVTGLPRFVETRGGAYFFLPSRAALMFLSELRAPILERAPEGESDDTLGLAALHVAKIEADWKAQKAPKHARRGFHAKCHGIVRARVDVDRDLAPSFQAGVFRPGASYPAWVRFSSASFFPQSDEARDVHGLAIKLMAVPDEPRAATFEEQTQDFVLIDAPQLMVGDVKAALGFDRAAVRGGLRQLWHLLTHMGQALSVARITSAPRHLFEREYTSITAFMHGPQRAVRYVVRLAPDQHIEAAERDADGLRDALQKTLERGDLKLELCLQSQGLDPLPIEDARIAWPADAQRVALITLSAEGFGTPEQERLGEGLSFNPWNALEAHRPLGGLNRARRVVYRAVYDLRSSLNGRKPFEPTSHALDEGPGEKGPGRGVKS